MAQPCPCRGPPPGSAQGCHGAARQGHASRGSVRGQRCPGVAARGSSGARSLPQPRCPLSTWPPRPLPKWPPRRRGPAGKLRAGRSMAVAAPGISMAAGAALARRRENVPGCLLLPAGRGQGQLRGGEPGAAPPGPQAGSEGLGRGARARRRAQLGVRGMAGAGLGVPRCLVRL